MPLGQFILNLWSDDMPTSEILVNVEREYGAQHCILAEQIIQGLQAEFEETFTQCQG